MYRLFRDEYRRHPYWAASLIVLLAIGLALDFTFIPVAPLTSPNSGVLKDRSTASPSRNPYDPIR